MTETIAPLPSPETLDLALRQRARTVAGSWLDFVDAALEAEEARVHVHFRFADFSDYLEERVGVGYRSFRRWASVVEGLRRLPDGERDPAQRGLVELGSEKASILAPLLGRPGESVADWLELAASYSRAALQEAVSETLGHKTRGKPGLSQVSRCLRNALPPEIWAEVEEVIRVVKRVGETESDEAAIAYVFRSMRAELAAEGRL